MAAGQGFKTFTSGEVLTAADVNGYLMQGVGVFTNAANRDAEITSPQEGQFAYLSDTNVTTYYTGSAWANLDTTGMTNPMTTTGDSIYSSPGSTPVRLGIGTTGQVLTVAAGLPSWATPAAPSTAKSFSLISTTTTNTGSSFTISGLSGYDEIRIVFQSIGTNDTGNNQIRFQINGDTTNANYRQAGFAYTPSTIFSQSTLTSVTISDPGFKLCNHGTVTSMRMNGYLNLSGCNTSGTKLATQAIGVDEPGNPLGIIGGGYYSSSSVVSSITLITAGGSFTAGTMYVYGAV